ncbi:MAG: hypothetical protein AAGD92_07965 [Pseudomonadota bacterium]
METADYETRRGGAPWLLILVFLLVFLGAALSVAAYMFAEPSLTVAESAAAGFGGLAGVIIGLFGAFVGIVLGLFGALIGVATAGGAIAVTLFVLASPILAIVFLVLLLRRPKGDACPDPSVRK